MGSRFTGRRMPPSASGSGRKSSVRSPATYDAASFEETPHTLVLHAGHPPSAPGQSDSPPGAMEARFACPVDRAFRPAFFHRSGGLLHQLRLPRREDPASVFKWRRAVYALRRPVERDLPRLLRHRLLGALQVARRRMVVGDTRRAVGDRRRSRTPWNGARRLPTIRTASWRWCSTTFGTRTSWPTAAE